ncbi:MAG: DsrE family protein [Saprospiraceae bacterium]|nr:DsrE family protein [Saprospiraceae bacterium]
MSKIVLFFLAGLFLNSLSAQGTTSPNPAKSKKPTAAKHRVVIQLTTNDTSAWKGLMNNLKNLREGWGDAVEIEVVAHSHGIEMVMNAKTTQKMKIEEFIQSGIRFVACENTMKQKNIKKEEILPEVGYVPMGIGEIIMKQEKGWSYLKAGF